MVERGGKLVSVNLSELKGTRKYPLNEARVLAGFGVESDAHGGDWHRQVSLLAKESIDKMTASGLDVGPGAFGENLTTERLDLVDLPIGTRIKVGGSVVLKVTQIGKECDTPCAIYHQAGDCVMPREGIFAEVVVGGTIVPGDSIFLLPSPDEPGD